MNYLSNYQETIWQIWYLKVWDKNKNIDIVTQQFPSQRIQIMKYFSVVFMISIFSTAIFAETPAGHPSVDHKAMMNQIVEGEPDSDLNLQGKAISVLPVSGYVYIEVSPESGDKFWMAVPEDIVVKEGDTVRYKEGPVMTDFKSKSLDRTFPSVMFLSKVIITSNTQ